MAFILLALVVALLGTVPLLVGQRWLAAVITASISWLVLTVVFYLGTPTMVWPWWGAYGLFVWFLWIIGAVIDGIINEGPRPSAAFPLLLTVFYGSNCFVKGSEFINDQAYANMLGNVEERTWTQDVQPKDPRHIRMSSSENATQLARQTLGQAGAIGSQFQIDENRMTLQKIGDEFWWVAPLDFKEWATWRKTRRVPAYVRVSAEDPTLPGDLVFIKEEWQPQYTPGAYWEHNLGRHLWHEGYYDKGLTEDSLEIDDSGKPWWVVTVFHPTIFDSGKRVDGVVVVDPATGGNEFYPLGKIPDWVDRVIPSEFVSDYIQWRGMLHLGWGNAYWITGAGEQLTIPEKPNLIYGSDGYLQWATGITSTNSNDTSLIGLYYTHSRTGETAYYKAQGSTDEAIIQAVDNDDKVKFRQLHGADAQLYNVQGTMASIVPLLNENHLFQGVVMVNVQNIQIMGIGDDQFAALREYQKALPLSGQQISPEFKRDIQRIQGVVDRRADVVQGGEVIVYLHIRDVPHLFSGSPKLSVELPMTREGDTVLLDYYASGEQIEPMSSFDNLALQLESTRAETEVGEMSSERKQELQKQEDADDARENLKNLSDEEILKLQEELKKK
ncbi:MAG TPA: hypothetical protein VJ046_03100 [Candidatus Paceibacterota bacterium]|nr:hypothetical protein [Candidatus Paceibacterota bacterium]